MRFKPLLLRSFSLSLLSMASFACAQVLPAAREAPPPYAAGGGLSSWDVDWGHGRMLGITVWGDVHPRLPAILYGLGAEAEYRNVNWGRNDQPSNFRQQTAGGGPIYTWSRYPNFRPTAKFLIDYARMDFTIPQVPGYTHDSRKAYAPGAALEYRVHKGLWARVDWEYQIWQPMFGDTRPTPQGFTLGAMYDFRGPARNIER